MSKRFHCPAWISVRKKPLIKCLVSAVIFAALYILLMYMRTQTFLPLDGLFLAAMLMLMIGLWYLVRWLGLFDFTAYSWKRFIRSLQRRRADETIEPMPSYAEYLQQPHPLPSAGEPLLTALLLFLVYLIIEYC